MSVKCEKVQKPERHALVIHTRTPVEKLPQAIGSSYQKIGTLMGKHGEQPIDVPYVAYYNMDMQDLDVEIGFIVGRPLEGEGDVKALVYPAGAVLFFMSPPACTKDRTKAWDQPTKPSRHGSRSKAWNPPAWCLSITSMTRRKWDQMKS